ncbi:MAG: hypothetical protein H7X85_08710 [Thermoanaerobaculia bacterium]|nr:hypothetical protein [Thermoanaerobaculia bacterium]
MSWLFWVGLAVAVGLIAALTGVKPKGTKPVARTQMMGIARIILVLIVLALLFAGYRGCGAGG